MKIEWKTHTNGEFVQCSKFTNKTDEKHLKLNFKLRTAP